MVPTTGVTPADILASLNPWWLFLSLIPSGIGFVLFVYGKKQQRSILMATGALFMVYPYFTETIASMVLVGALLGSASWLAVRSGW